MSVITDKQMQGSPASKDIWLIEDGARGSGRFMGRITPAGDRSFYYRYTTSDGKRDTLPIGPYDTKGLKGLRLTEARSKAAELTKLYQSGVKDVRQHLADLEIQKAESVRRQKEEAETAALEAIRQAESVMSLRKLFEKWVATELRPHVRADGTRSGRKDGGALCRLQFEKHIFPSLGDKDIQQVRKKDLMEVLDAVKAEGKLRTCNVLLTNLKQMFQFALIRELVERNPLDLVTKRQAGGLEASRDRVLSPAEIQVLTNRLPQSGLTRTSQLAIWLLLATGTRVGELMSAEWKDVNLDGKTWHIPDTKNQRPHTVHLSNFALKQFRLLAENRSKMVDGQPVPWVFPGRDLKKSIDIKTFGKQLVDRQRSEAQKLRGRSKAVDSLSLPGGKWTPHDLRRTAATIMARLGVSSDVIDECLNHMISSRVTRVYIRDRREAEQATAFDLLGAELELLTNAET